MSANNPRLTCHEQYDNDEDYDTKPTPGHADIFDTTDITTMYNRPGNACKKGKFARAEKYVEDDIHKTGVYAEAGVGRAHAEYSVFEAEAKGPNASAGAEISGVGAGAMARAEIASASAKAGPVGVKVGLGFDTGLSAGLDGVEAKVLGTGFSVGKKTSVSVLGNEASCSVM
ncbi:hypothetical protein Q8A67_016967 [Cirrhinus molitorella]|uniref:Uncharacterized protein n=1 Tax=Cirrhinus molitorella TaxID=172907 RepID=A0AA88PDW1_9TELE|nr:hypothetical protein Q8A67_016967 [Cirrhinus molitorella]